MIQQKQSRLPVILMWKNSYKKEITFSDGDESVLAWEQILGLKKARDLTQKTVKECRNAYDNLLNRKKRPFISGERPGHERGVPFIDEKGIVTGLDPFSTFLRQADIRVSIDLERIDDLIRLRAEKGDEFVINMISDHAFGVADGIINLAILAYICGLKHIEYFGHREFTFLPQIREVLCPIAFEKSPIACEEEAEEVQRYNRQTILGLMKKIKSGEVDAIGLHGSGTIKRIPIKNLLRSVILQYQGETQKAKNLLSVEEYAWASAGPKLILNSGHGIVPIAYEGQLCEAYHWGAAVNQNLQFALVIPASLQIAEKQESIKIHLGTYIPDQILQKGILLSLLEEFSPDFDWADFVQDTKMPVKNVKSLLEEAFSYRLRKGGSDTIQGEDFEQDLALFTQKMSKRLGKVFLTEDPDTLILQEYVDFGIPWKAIGTEIQDILQEELSRKKNINRERAASWLEKRFVALVKEKVIHDLKQKNITDIERLEEYFADYEARLGHETLNLNQIYDFYASQYMKECSLNLLQTKEERVEEFA